LIVVCVCVWLIVRRFVGWLEEEERERERERESSQSFCTHRVLRRNQNQNFERERERESDVLVFAASVGECWFMVCSQKFAYEEE
jgi:hypothetical protein